MSSLAYNVNLTFISYQNNDILVYLRPTLKFSNQLSCKNHYLIIFQEFI